MKDVEPEEEEPADENGLLSIESGDDDDDDDNDGQQDEEYELEEMGPRDENAGIIELEDAEYGPETNNNDCKFYKQSLTKQALAGVFWVETYTGTTA